MIVTVCIVEQVLNVYVIIPVPGATPVTSPVLLSEMEASEVVLHVPPGEVLASCEVRPLQIIVFPEI